MNYQQLTKQQLEDIYEMVDNIPFSRPKKNIHRDFADGVMMAELLHHYFPKLVELHNYPQANSFSTKLTNWQTLNTKVFKKIGINLRRKDLQNVVNCVPNSIETVLKTIFNKVEQPWQENKPKATNVGQSNTNTKNPLKQTNIAENNNSQQISELQQKIDEAYMQLLKLQEISHLKDGVIRTLEKKLHSYL